MILETGQIKKIYETALLSIDMARGTAPAIEVEFYPYVGISSRIRLRGGTFFVRISDILSDAPAEFHAALAQILIRKLFRRSIPAKDLQIYRDYLKQTLIQEKSIANRRARGRKIVTTAKGKTYNLDEIFLFLNQIYFQNALAKPTLTWSAKKTFRILGHHDSAHETIAVSKSLDDPHVPRFVVEYVVYHEMLHIKHPTSYRNGRRYNHTPQFRRDEREFAFFEEAENWIEQNIKAIRKNIKRSRARN